MDELRLEIADVLARLPVRCDDDAELDKLRRLEAATAILAIPELREAIDMIEKHRALDKLVGQRAGRSIGAPMHDPAPSTNRRDPV